MENTLTAPQGGYILWYVSSGKRFGRNKQQVIK